MFVTTIDFFVYALGTLEGPRYQWQSVPRNTCAICLVRMRTYFLVNSGFKISLFSEPISRLVHHNFCSWTHNLWSWTQGTLIPSNILQTCVWERVNEWVFVCVHVCVWERESMCACVCVRVCLCAYAPVWVRGRVCERVSMYLFDYVKECM